MNTKWLNKKKVWIFQYRHREGCIWESNRFASASVTEGTAILVTDCRHNYEQQVPQISCFSKITIYEHQSHNTLILHQMMPKYKGECLAMKSRWVPEEQVAMMRPSRWGFGLRIFTIIHPSIPPNKKVNPMFTGINHLQEQPRTEHYNFESSLIFKLINHLITRIFTRKWCHQV